MPRILLAFSALLAVLFPLAAFAATLVEEGEGAMVIPSMTGHVGAYICLGIFLLSYLAVLLEERTHLRKSKPVMLGAGLIWVTIGIIAPSYGIDHEQVRSAVYHGLEEYGSLFLFLLAAMTYISALQDRQVFAALRSRLVAAGMNMRQLFWATGIFAFFLSPIADNLTTALVLGAVVMAVGADHPKFVLLACINIVNAANAGGAFSPFGDITTLMVWQAGKIPFFDFFPLFFPSLASFLVPAIVMSFFVENDQPHASAVKVEMRRGAKSIIFLGLCTIAMAVSFEQLLGLPPFIGMMTGMGVLMIYGYAIRQFGARRDVDFDILSKVALAEWDTLLFFFGVIFSVGGLAFLGYLEMASSVLYDGLGADVTNIALGIVSALIDNIPVMFAVLSMDPQMSEFHWLLITLTCGIGGSLLSIGSAAGVALMGTAKGQYTFLGHLKWTPVLCLGYAAAVGVHYLVNASIGASIGQ